jgi:hypothetical protein
MSVLACCTCQLDVDSAGSYTEQRTKLKRSCQTQVVLLQGVLFKYGPSSANVAFLSGDLAPCRALLYQNCVLVNKSDLETEALQGSTSGTWS